MAKQSKHSPEKLCNDSIFKYVLPRELLAAAKRQVIHTLGTQTVIFQEHTVSVETVELYVIVASVSTSQKETLTALQDSEVLVQKIASSSFGANQLHFGESSSSEERGPER